MPSTKANLPRERALRDLRDPTRTGFAVHYTWASSAQHRSAGREHSLAHPPGSPSFHPPREGLSPTGPPPNQTLADQAAAAPVPHGEAANVVLGDAHAFLVAQQVIEQDRQQVGLRLPAAAGHPAPTPPPTHSATPSHAPSTNSTNSAPWPPATRTSSPARSMSPGSASGSATPFHDPRDTAGRSDHPPLAPRLDRDETVLGTRIKGW